MGQHHVNIERRKLVYRLEKFLEGPMIFLGFVWLVLLLIELTHGLNKILEYISLSIWFIFIIDFLLKFILAPEKWIYVKRNVLTIISLIIPAFRIFRILRVFRFVRSIKLIKVLGSLNRSIKSLAFTMQRRGFAYVAGLSLIVAIGGAAGMYALEKGNPGFDSFGMALWWSSMRIITAGSDYWPLTPEGRMLAFIISLFGYSVFGYVTASLASFFIGNDADNEKSAVAGAKDIAELKQMLKEISRKLPD